MAEYTPTPEDYRLAEESMTPEQAALSEAREEGYHLGRAALDAEWEKENAESVERLELSTPRLTQGFRLAMKDARITTKAELMSMVSDGTISRLKGVGPAMQKELAGLLKTK